MASKDGEILINIEIMHNFIMVFNHIRNVFKNLNDDTYIHSKYHFCIKNAWVLESKMRELIIGIFLKINCFYPYELTNMP